MADYDSYSDMKVVTATAAGFTLDGTETSSIDLKGWQSCTFAGLLEAAVAWSAISVTMEESDDNSTWSAVDSSNVLFRKPADDSQTVDTFTAGYIGKKRYVRAKPVTGGTGKVVANLGHPHVAPHDQAELESA